MKPAFPIGIFELLTKWK